MSDAITNALTFDIEEYFHAEVFAGVVRRDQWLTLESRVVAATERLLGLLRQSGTRATFFVLGWVAERQRNLVRAIRSEGHELGCHGYWHQRITQLTRAEFREDVRRAKRAIEDVAGTEVIGYRAPTFSVVRETMWSLEILAETGFRYDSSIFPIVHDRYGIVDAPRFPHRVGPAGAELVEFPLSTIGGRRWRLPVAGGGYFRLAPYRLTRLALRHLNRNQGQPFIIYLHPWELDPDQPQLPVGVLSRVRHSINTGGTEAKLRQLLRDFSFAPAREVLVGSGMLMRPAS